MLRADARERVACVRARLIHRAAACELAGHQLLEHGVAFRGSEGSAAEADRRPRLLGAGAVQGAALHAHDALVGALDAGRHAQQRGASGASPAPHAHQFALLQLERHVVQRDPLRRSAAEALAHTLKLEQGHLWTLSEGR